MTSSSRRLGDYPEVMLRNGKAPSLDMLLALVPDEPLLVAEPYESLTAGTGEVIVTRCGDYKIVHRQWRKSDLALRKRSPGLQLDYHFREARKYNSPYGEPLSGWVRELLNTAKMHWSRAVEAYGNGWAKYMGLCVDCTNLQFRDWLPGYMDQSSWYAGFGGKTERWDEAGQIVRIACGLARFAPTRRAKP
jgi:hypothetical protein